MIELRRRLLNSVAAAVEDFRAGLLGSRDPCSFECSAMLLGALAKQMHEVGWPMAQAAAAGSSRSSRCGVDDDDDDDRGVDHPFAQNSPAEALAWVGRLRVPEWRAVYGNHGFDEHASRRQCRAGRSSGGGPRGQAYRVPGADARDWCDGYCRTHRCGFGALERAAIGRYFGVLETWKREGFKTGAARAGVKIDASVEDGGLAFEAVRTFIGGDFDDGNLQL